MDKTVVKAFQVLEALSNSDKPRGVTELAAEVAMTKANVHRLVRTLTELGYVRQPEDTSRYEPSLKLWGLGANVVQKLDLTVVAAPIVRALRNECRESVQLAVRDGDAIVYVDKADSQRPVRATTRIGSRVPMHCISTGKAILAASESAFAALTFPLKRSTPHTRTTRPQLEKQLAEVRRVGYAVNRGEWREGIWGIAAPIRGADWEVTGAIGIWGPEDRFQGGALKNLAAAVVGAANNISAHMGNRMHVAKTGTGIGKRL